jgi:hypothetical protein
MEEERAQLCLPQAAWCSGEMLVVVVVVVVDTLKESGFMLITNV